jgi:hypothetical protein
VPRRGLALIGSQAQYFQGFCLLLRLGVYLLCVPVPSRSQHAAPSWATPNGNE